MDCCTLSCLLLMKGKKQKQLEIAKKMKEENMDIEQISRITNLKPEEIEEL